MKRVKRFLRFTSLALLTIPVPTAVFAQLNPGQGGAVISRGPSQPPSAPGMAALRAGTPVNLKEGAPATQLLDLRVNNRHGETLGTVKDFAVDLPSSRVAYVLVSSQGATVHPVPPQALNFDPAQLLGQNVMISQQGAIGQISDVFIDLKNGSSALIVGGAQTPASGSTPP